MSVTIPAGPVCTGTCERCKLKIRTMEYHDPDAPDCDCGGAGGDR